MAVVHRLILAFVAMATLDTNVNTLFVMDCLLMTLKFALLMDLVLHPTIATVLPVTQVLHVTFLFAMENCQMILLFVLPMVLVNPLIHAAACPIM
jgi:hypothetical protein